jgi:hypothetical protein
MKANARSREPERAVWAPSGANAVMVRKPPSDPIMKISEWAKLISCSTP